MQAEYKVLGWHVTWGIHFKPQVASDQFLPEAQQNCKISLPFSLPVFSEPGYQRLGSPTLHSPHRFPNNVFKIRLVQTKHACPEPSTDNYEGVYRRLLCVFAVDPFSAPARPSAVIWMLVSPQFMLKSNAHCDGVGGGALGAPRNGISALCPREIPHPFCHVRFQQTAVYQPSRSSLETESAWHPHLLELPTSRIVRHKFLLSVTHPVSGVLFRQCKGTKSPP